jgi:hypothetical protein
MIEIIKFIANSQTILQYSLNGEFLQGIDLSRKLTNTNEETGMGLVHGLYGLARVSNLRFYREEKGQFVDVDMGYVDIDSTVEEIIEAIHARARLVNDTFEKKYPNQN